VVISNCVINLSPDKARVFRDTFRVIRPGGRMMVSDIVLLKELPDFIKSSINAYVGCVAGAMLKEEYIETIRAASFENVEIVGEATFPTESMADDPMVKAVIEESNLPIDELREIGNSIISIKVKAVKPL
jgi:hypothetical protein